MKHKKYKQLLPIPPMRVTLDTSDAHPVKTPVVKLFEGLNQQFSKKGSEK